MIKKLLALVAMIIGFQTAHAQFNVTFISDLAYNQDLSDIWGYAAPDGTEYALVGVRNGTSIVSLADPANPEEVAFITGDNSIWRDIKVWGTYAYVTTDQGDDGLTVIDLSDLPNTANYFQMTDFGTLGTLETCHNIWIDESGIAYLAGCNLNNGGMIFVDVATTPGLPQYIAPAPNIYAHDVYTRDNKMYASEIYDGVFTVYDVSDKFNVQYLGDKQTDFSFTHNAWLNDAGNVLFTTDELADAPVGSYDVSNPSDIQTLDLFKPLTTLGAGVIPHNVHVFNDWIIISYYTDGCIIVDGSNPSNLIEVGNFDTYFPANTGFDGAWGAYPFLPSGLILVSDIGNGLYVLEPNYVRACWLEGQVTNSVTGNGVADATIEIITTELNESSIDGNGEYKTGLAIAGTYEVVYSAPGYFTQTLSLSLENDVLLIQDVALIPFPEYVVSGQVKDAFTGQGIPNADVLIYNNGLSYLTEADANGMYTFSEISQGDYVLLAGGSWGHITGSMNLPIMEDMNAADILLERGYQDEFVFDQGWTVSGDAETGDWVRGEPNGTFDNNGQEYNPEFDLENDLGDQCYVTGNSPGGGVGGDDVDNGTTTLTSPSMDLTPYIDPAISFYAWFVNGGGNGNPNDEMVVRLNNGMETIELLTINENTNGWEGPYTFMIPDSIITENMTIEFETADQVIDNNGHLLECAIDLFQVTGELVLVSSNNNINTDFQMTAMPNPFSSSLTIAYDLPAETTNARLVIYNSLGQLMTSKSLSENKGTIIIEDLIFRGLYLVQMEADGLVSAPMKVMKVE